MFRKILSLLLVFLIISFNIPANASEQSLNAESADETMVVPKRIENEINNCIIQIYGERQAKDIYEKVMEIAKEGVSKRPDSLKKEDLTRADDWYKDEIIYMFYVDQFGVVSPEKPNTFRDTSIMFDYLKML